MKPTIESTNNTPSYGVIVSWSIRNAFVHRDAIGEALKSEGVNVAVKTTSASTYLRRAVEQACADSVIRKIGEDVDSVAYAVITEERSLKSVTWAGSLREAIRMNKKTGRVEFKQDSALVGDIRSALKSTEGGLLSAEIGGILCGVATDLCHGVALRDLGGVYFIPRDCVDMFARAEKALKSALNKGARMHINMLQVIAGVREAKDIADVYAVAVRERITVARDHAAELLKDITHAKPSTFVKRAKVMRELISEMHMYEGTLGADFKDLKALANNSAAAFMKASAACLAARARARAEERQK